MIFYIDVINACNCRCKYCFGVDVNEVKKEIYVNFS